MKILSYLSLIIGIATLIAGIYLVVELVPKVAVLDSMMYGEESYYFDDTLNGLMMDQLSFKTDFAIAVMFGGLAAVLLAIVPVIKKQKIAWVGLLTGLVSAVIGAMHGTHMFS